jgi:heparin/heparan-sulfate lyase
MKESKYRNCRRGFLKKMAVVPVLSYLPFPLKINQETSEKDYSWMSSIKGHHPRLFLNSTTFPQIKARALHEESGIFQAMKDRIDLLIGKKVVFQEPLAKDGTTNDDHDIGTRACEAAFLFLSLGEKKYLDYCRELLVIMRDYYHLRLEHHLNIHWYAWSTINTLAAFDWIYNHLTKKEQVEIGKPLLSAMNQMAISEGREEFYRENTGGITTGFYGPPC